LIISSKQKPRHAGDGVLFINQLICLLLHPATAAGLICTRLFADEETIQTIFGDFIAKANRLLSLAAVLHRASL